MDLIGSVRAYTLVFTGKQGGQRVRRERKEKRKFNSGGENWSLAAIGRNQSIQTSISKLNKNLPT